MPGVFWETIKLLARRRIRLSRRSQQAGKEQIISDSAPFITAARKRTWLPIQGIDTLAEVCRLVPQPVIAIAGITVDKVTEVFNAGAHGIAVMTAVSTREDPFEAARAFRAEIDRIFL